MEVASKTDKTRILDDRLARGVRAIESNGGTATTQTIGARLGVSGIPATYGTGFATGISSTIGATNYYHLRK